MHLLYRSDTVEVTHNDNSTKESITVKSEWQGEIDSVVVDKKTGKIVVYFKENEREMKFGDSGDYIAPEDKDKNFKTEIIE